VSSVKGYEEEAKIALAVLLDIEGRTEEAIATLESINNLSSIWHLAQVNYNWDQVLFFTVKDLLLNYLSKIYNANADDIEKLPVSMEEVVDLLNDVNQQLGETGEDMEEEGEQELELRQGPAHSSPARLTETSATGPMYGVNRMPPQQHMYAYQAPTHTPPLQTAPPCIYPPQDPLRFESQATGLLSPYSEEYYGQNVAQQTTNPTLPEPGYFTKPSVVPVQPPKGIEGKPVDFGKLSFNQQASADVPRVLSFGAGAAAQSAPSPAFKFNTYIKSMERDPSFSASQTKQSESLLGLLTTDLPPKTDAGPEKPPAQEQPPSNQSIFTFGNKNITSFSFADSIQKTPAGSLFGKVEQPFKFGEVTIPAFGIGKAPELEKAAESDNESTHAEEDEDGPHFEPIVPLPDKVDVKTGEEEEEEMFCNRAKLYRFDAETKEWKERGIGNVKILKHNTKGKVRLLMRREQVLKICANHYITADMLLKPNAASDKSWVWNAIDYADEEPKPEQLAIRFKTVDEAALFKAKFEDAQNVALNSPEKPKPQEKKESSKDSASLAARFALKVGEWECPVCSVRNKAMAMQCAACTTANPQSSSKSEPQLTGETKSSPFTFKFGTDSSKPSGSSSTFTGFGAFGTSGTSSFTFGVSSSKPADKTASPFGFSFGSQFATKPEQWDCGKCSAKNDVSTDSCDSCKTPKTAAKTPMIAQIAPAPEAPIAQAPASAVDAGFAARFSKKPGQWDCNVCEVRNEASADKCVSCQSPHMAPKSSAEAPAASTVPTSSGLEADSARKDGPWDCNACLVRNEASAAECVSCHTPNPNPSLEAMFGKKEGEWDCDSCLVRNKSSCNQCVACKTPNPNAKSTSTAAHSASSFSFNFATKSSSSQPAGAAFTFGTGGTFQFGQNKEKGSSAAFKFQTPQSVPVTSSSSGFSFSMPIPAGGFKFGVQDSAEDSSSSDNQTPSGSASSVLKNMADKHKEKETGSTLSVNQIEEDQNPLIAGKANTFSFADLAKSSEGTFQFVQKDPNFKGFSGAGEQVFSSSQTTPTKAEASNDLEDEGMYKTEEHDDIQFEPVVQMPEKVDLVTGEEDEQVLYSQRVKLFRFDSCTSQWKERGVGVLKFLKNNTNGRLRVLMRREQVLKVCANHWITTTMNLKPLAGSDKAWMWMANDFSDGDAKLEQLAAKFKTTELAEEFKRKFEECQRLLLDIPLQTPHKLMDTGRTAHLIKKAEEMKSGLKDLKLFLTDEKTKIQGDDTQGDVTTASEVSGLGIRLQGETTGPTLEWDNYDLREEALDDTADSSIYTTPVASSPFRKNLFRFGESTGGFSFSFQPGISPSKSPAKLNLSRASAGTDEEQDTSQDEERDGQYFEPVVPLPDLVEISTGEENELVVFSHRSKLYRYDKEVKQWKERGIGDLKILQNYDTKRVRLIMRRDQVLKLCANHWISAAMRLEPMKGAEKAWVWSALDFAEEGEGKVEQLAVRFKTQETANTFKQAFEESKVALGKAELMTPVTTRVAATPESGPAAASEGTTPSVCGHAAISVLEETTRERTASPPGTRPTAASQSPVNPMKTVVSPPKFVFGTDSVQKIFGSPKSESQASASVSGFTAKDGGSSVKAMLPAPAFKMHTGLDFRLFKDNPMAFWTSTSAIQFETPDEDFESAVRALSGKLYPDPPAAAAAVCAEGKPLKHQGSVGLSHHTTFIPATKMHLSYAPLHHCVLLSEPDCQFVWEKKPTPEEEEKAKSLQLPPTFFCGLSTTDSDLDNEEPEDFETELCKAQQDLVETKSGEEDEEILFKERAKLYRWDRDLGQWKERGIGDLKILFHPNKHFYRILMRRDQVLRVCANHTISQAMELKPMNASANALVWTATDYSGTNTEHSVHSGGVEISQDIMNAVQPMRGYGIQILPGIVRIGMALNLCFIFPDGDGLVEQLAAKFKTTEIAESFKKTFCECQSRIDPTGDDASSASAPHMSRVQEHSKDTNPLVFLKVAADGEPLGTITIELFSHIVPKTAENFRALCTGEKGFGLQNSIFHRVIPDFMCQGGDITKSDGSGGKSIYGSAFEDENFDVRHTGPGILSMANRGRDTNTSQFFITLKKAEHLDFKHVAFGFVRDGMDVVQQMGELGTKGGVPAKKLAITECGQLKLLREEDSEFQLG
ncbi:hypothetical protein XENOCAPTIV_006824, partial [Xenoophorus captivus]